ncbi:MAG TPA: HEAT repeat domain-containing protein [Tepidisphaeraceae bacterium]|nr:HEAT repeat domain-containing protein [Tepidisphaeraceae bacterium]
MAFEINLPHRIDVCLLRYAGMETDAYHHRSMDVIIKQTPVPFEVQLPYFLTDPPAKISVIMLENGKFVRLRIAAPDAAIERRIRKYLERYSAENDGEAVMDREHKEVWKRINTILKRHGMSYEKLSRGEALLNRRAIEELIELADQLPPDRMSNISALFSNGHVVRADKEFAVRWLMKRLAKEPDPSTRGDLSLRIWENTVPAIGAELIKLIERERGMFGGASSGLIMALAQTKHPRAADFIASILDDPHVSWAGLQALAKLKTTQHADKIGRYLRDPDHEIRREAKKALKKLGLAAEQPPPPVHLVKGKAKMPNGLEEWSRNLDMDELEPIPKTVANCIERGFGDSEVAEVIAVAEEMKPDQTKIFRFPVRAGKARGELWLVIFLDDIDSPDLEVHASAAVIEKFTRLSPLWDAAEQA